jgi:hypothetical protein
VREKEFQKGGNTAVREREGGREGEREIEREREFEASMKMSPNFCTELI